MNHVWEKLTPGQLQVAVEALVEIIKSRSEDAGGAITEELQALGSVHSALYLERKARAGAMIAKAGREGGFDRRRKVK